MSPSKLLSWSMSILVALTVGGCAHVNVTKPSAPGGKGPAGGTAGSTTTAATNTGAANQQPASGQQAQASVPVAGDWQFGFQFNNSTLHATVHIDQQGQQFSGTGTDDETKLPFTIEQGQLNAGQVQFYKKYESGKSPEIQYTGTLEMANDGDLKGPYMHGEYSTSKDGKIVSNIWEAALLPPGSAKQPVQQAQEQAAPDEDNIRLNKTPELSGKWNVGYEYNFKTILSTMFLEQDGDRITGHGVDDTHEKFVIEKGWYHFPHLTLIRKWQASTVAVPAKPHHGKGKGKAKTVVTPERTMTFKATVSVVHNSHYSGPYLSGKTQGGGSWRAEMYK